jgi:DNA-binding GntR family transcriptional regulator
MRCAIDAIRTVIEQFTPVLRRLERLRFSSLSGRSSVAQHDRIIALCAAGDIEAAAAATRANWQTLLPLLGTGLADSDRRSLHVR